MYTIFCWQPHMHSDLCQISTTHWLNSLVKVGPLNRICTFQAEKYQSGLSWNYTKDQRCDDTFMLMLLDEDSVDSFLVGM